MAKRRMFSSDVTDNDDFLSMPATSQLLYFQLGMNADDEGFVTPRFIMRKCGFNDDDLKILIVKNFVIPFEDRVVVITHWKINNYLQSDRIIRTQYQNYRSQITSDVSKMYTKCIPTNKLTNKLTKEEISISDNVTNNRKELAKKGMELYFEGR